MRIVQAEKEDLSIIKNLWKVGFGETDDFLEFYFRERYKREGTLIAREDDQVPSSLQTIPAILQHQGKKLASAYILGIVTHPNYRKQGYADSLIKAALLEQSQKDILVSSLIPAQPYLFDVYRKYGFTEIFSIQEQEILLKDLTPNNDKDNYSICRYSRENLPLEPKLMELFYDFYSQTYELEPCSILKSKEDFLFCVKEFLLFEGDIYMLFHEGRVAASSFFVFREEKWFAKEFLFKDESCKNFLLREFLIKTKQKSIVVKSPPSKDTEVSPKPLGMARIIDVYGILQALAEGTSFSFEVKVMDAIIQKNNAVFLINNGKVKIGKETDAVDLTMTIQDFTLFVLGYGLDTDRYLAGQRHISGYMNMMLND